uniref:Keratin n=1 Tax=Taeniopygia guttata TaxID=59729 RepID=A0A674H6N6_TAEGU
MSCCRPCPPRPCGPCGPTPLASSCTEPCLARCADSMFYIEPSPVVVTLPGPILTSFPQSTAVGSSLSAAVGSSLSTAGVPISSGGSLGLGAQACVCLSPAAVRSAEPGASSPLASANGPISFPPWPPTRVPCPLFCDAAFAPSH